MDVYMHDRFNASAILEVLTMNDSWEFEKQFECPLDFSSIEWESNTIRINAVDNSLAALIKANKSTKYELQVGTQVPTHGNLRVTRLPMKETLTYGFTQGTSYEDSEDITVTFNQGERPWVGNIDSEVVINHAVYWKDDQEDEPNSYMLKIIKDVQINFSYKFGYRSNKTTNAVDFALYIKRGGSVVTDYACGHAATCGMYYLGSFHSKSELPDTSQPIQVGDKDARYNCYALINGIVLLCVFKEGRFEWEETGKSEDEYFLVEQSGTATLDLKAGDVVYIGIQGMMSTVATVRFTHSEFVFDWMAVGDDTYVDVCKPMSVAKSILGSMVGGAMNVHVEISEYDPRIANTYIMAAESVRSIPSAKLYTSFNEFCDWMETVFGYVYYIGDPQPSKYTDKRDFGMIVKPAYTPTGHYSGDIDTSNIHYNPATAKFFYADDGGGYYDTWQGWSLYNADNGHPRTDTVFFERGSYPVIAWVFPEYSDNSDFDPIEYNGDTEEAGPNDKTVYFVHRSELFRDGGTHRRFDNCRDVKYSVDSGSIYSSVTVGYDKKDYESVNGRDEFNFNNTYTTGCAVTDKTLSLLSKYRADCYGIEFAIQKRSKDTTDTASDKDVFFALCKRQNRQLMIDRDCEIRNGISDALFNGAFSPMACIKANAGYIGLQADNLKLTFASSTGNSDIEIDGVPMTSDLTLDTPIASVGSIEFTTDDVEIAGDENNIIEVESDGVLYRGFLKEVDIKYARTEAAKYKLIVKDIEIW